MNWRFPTLAALAVLLFGCSSPDEMIDYGSVCVSTDEVAGQQRLLVDAASGDCAKDHEGASFECTITVDGTTAHIETVFQDGKDPNGACGGQLETTCEIDVEPGTYTLAFKNYEQMIMVPGGPQTCLPDPIGDTEGP